MDLNVLVFSGRLGKDPDTKHISSDKVVTNFPVAVKLAKDKTMWLDVSVWGRQAETCNQYLKKGSQVYISGSLVQDQWEDESGNRRTKFKVVANVVQFAPKSSEQSSGDYSGPEQDNELPPSPAADEKDSFDEFEFPL